MKVQAFNLILLFTVVAFGCQEKASTDTAMTNFKTLETMNSFISIFEIPATDIGRAVTFYQALLSVDIQTIDMQGMQMGLLPSEGQAVSGVITQGEGYEPSADGVLIHLNGGDDLQPMLDRVAKNGGEVILPKTLIDEENGYFALFLDTEGNRMGLHSPN
ncbi:MAG: VOC family protein [Cyclobacteriaceae bacterium]